MSTIVSGSDGIVFPDATTQPSAVGLSFRNKIINGKLDFWQRGTSISLTAGGTNAAYLADRFYVGTAATTEVTTYSQQSFTVGQTDVPGNPRYFARSACTNGGDATNGYHYFQQPIEDVSTLAGKTATFSFWAKADSAKNISIEWIQQFGSGGSPSSMVRSFVQKIAVTSSWTKYTVTFTLPSISGKTIGSDGWVTSCLYIRFWLSAGSTYNSNTGTLGIQTGTFDFAMLQLEEGSYATAFEDRPYGLELSLCQRYYQVVNGNGNPTTRGVPMGVCMSSTQIEGVGFSLLVPPRVNLGLGANTFGVNEIFVNGNTKLAISTKYGLSAYQDGMVRFYFTVASGAVQGTTAYAADANNFIFNAEF